MRNRTADCVWPQLLYLMVRKLFNKKDYNSVIIWSFASISKGKSQYIIPEQRNEEILLRKGRTTPWERVFPCQQEAFQDHPVYPCVYPLTAWVTRSCAILFLGWKNQNERHLMKDLVADRMTVEKTIELLVSDFASLSILPTPSQWNLSLFPSSDFICQQKN